MTTDSLGILMCLGYYLALLRLHWSIISSSPGRKCSLPIFARLDRSLLN